MSFPSWERGLKQAKEQAKQDAEKSFPSWERGLKRELSTIRHTLYHVVPLVGTWIETSVIV